MKILGKIILWALSLLLILFSLATGTASSVMLVLGALLLCPLKILDNLRNRIKLKRWLSVVLSVVLFFAAILGDTGNLAGADIPVSSVSPAEIQSEPHSIPNEDISEAIERVAPTLAIESPVPSPAPAAISAPTSTPTSESTKAPSLPPSTSPSSTPTPTPSPAPTPSPTPTPSPAPERSYILNTNTRKFHYPGCSSVSDIKDGNKQEYTGTREAIIAMGYDPCGRCHP